MGCGAFVLAGIVAAVTSVAVVYTRPSPKSVTKAPTQSLEPSVSPSDIPSMSPSTTLFGYLALYSPDFGHALHTTGSPQQQAMDWLTKNTQIILGSELLQKYVLATLYYATFGNQWLNTVNYQLQRFFWKC